MLFLTGIVTKCSSKLKNAAINMLPSCRPIRFPHMEKFQRPCRDNPWASAAARIWDVHGTQHGSCRTAGLFAGQGLPPVIARAAARNGTAGPCLHPTDKGSSMAFAVLQLLLVHHFGQHFAKFKWPGWGKGVWQGEGAAAGLLHSQLNGGADEEGEPGAPSRKSSETPEWDLLLPTG